MNKYNFHQFLKSLDDNNLLKIYINNNEFPIDKEYFINQLIDAFNVIIEGKTDNAKWLENKKKEIQSDKYINIDNTDFLEITSKKMEAQKNLISVLSELQAYGILNKTLFARFIEGKIEEKNKSTPDFICKYKNNKINIEVATLLGTSSKEKFMENQDELVFIYPFGKPNYDKNENDFTGLIQLINNIKSDEKQFNDDDINILFLNLFNPIYKLYMDNLMNNLYRPYYIVHQGDSNYIHMGAIWHAFYTQEKEDIFYSISNTDMITQNVYKMEYDGRFNKKDENKYSKIDFTIINAYNNIAIYQNLNTKKLIDSEIYRFLMSFPNLRYENMWINYPTNILEKRIKIELKFGKKYFQNAKKNKYYV